MLSRSPLRFNPTCAYRDLCDDPFSYEDSSYCYVDVRPDEYLSEIISADYDYDKSEHEMCQQKNQRYQVLTLGIGVLPDATAGKSATEDDT